MTATERSKSHQFTSRVSAPNVLQGMMQLEQANTRAKAANRVALDAGKRMLLNKKRKGCNRYYKPRELDRML